jgi:outer membrane protein OmpA-like peptidoglycan-associated protein
MAHTQTEAPPAASRRDYRIWVALALGLALALGGGAPATAQGAVEGRVLDLFATVLDLEFTVEDLGGGVAVLAAPVEHLAVTETETEITFELSGDVLFDFDSANIRAEAEAALARVAEVVNSLPEAGVLIGGHTDAKGSDSYNLGLSQRRAESVKAWLVANGVVGARLRTEGFGKARPVAPNTHPDGSDNPEGRQQNRRVEIAVQK